MSMVVYKNLSAMNAHRYLKLNEGNFTKSVERLSSGLRINRAADDPAGLVISEQFRSQVEGLNQAIRNANDGVSLVQTAEAALDEVTTVLRTMRNLALHASNTGASDEAAILADQEQIDASIETLNRIANTTAFGTRRLLNGSSGVTGTSDQQSISFIEGSVNTVGGTYDVNNLTASVKGEHRSEARTAIDGATYGISGDASELIQADSTLTISGTAVYGQTIEVNVEAGDDDAAVKLAIETAFTEAGFTEVTATVDLSVGGDIVIDGLNVLGADHDDALLITGTDDFAGGTLTRDMASSTDSTTLLGQNETIIIKNGQGSHVNVALKQGDSIGDAVARINSALSDAEFNVKVSYNDTAEQFVVENLEYGASDVIKYSISSSVIDGNSASGTGIALGVKGADQFIADGGGTNGVEGANVTGDIGGYTATSVGGVYLVGAAGTDAEGIKVRIDGGATDEGKISVEQNALQFQVGAFSNQTVKVALGDMRAGQLGATATGVTSMSSIDVASIDVTSFEGAQDALRIIDAAMDEVNSMRSSMGSFQKDILESSVRNLRVAAQNMAASESVIRDADMAQEMLDFSKAQILQSTGMAMLAQANQAPQSIMRLFG